MIAGSEDDDLAPGHKSVDIDEFLCRACRVYTCGTRAGDIESTARFFTASHGQYHGFCVKYLQSVLAAVGGYFFYDPAVFFFRLYVHDHRVQTVFYRFGFFDITKGIFRTRKLLTECVKSESVVDALIKYPAQLVISFEYEDVFDAFLGRESAAAIPAGPPPTIIESYNMLFSISDGLLDLSCKYFGTAAFLGYLLHRDVEFAAEYLHDFRIAESALASPHVRTCPSLHSVKSTCA